MLEEPRYPGKGSKPDSVIKLSCGKVHTHASFNQNLRELQQLRIKNDPPFRRTMISSNHCNCKSFANESESIIIRNLGLLFIGALIFTSFSTFKKIAIDLMVV